MKKILVTTFCLFVLASARCDDGGTGITLTVTYNFTSATSTSVMRAKLVAEAGDFNSEALYSKSAAFSGTTAVVKFKNIKAATYRAFGYADFEGEGNPVECSEAMFGIGEDAIIVTESTGVTHSSFQPYNCR